MISLMSSQPFYTNKVVERAVQKLSVVGPGGEVVIHHSNLDILQFISCNMPAHLKFVQQKLAQHFPHKTRSLAEHRAYISNILHFTERVPSFFNDVIVTIVERLIKIDVDVGCSYLDQSSGTDQDLLFSLEKGDGEGEDEECETTEKLSELLHDLALYAKKQSSLSEGATSAWCRALLLAFDCHILRAHIPPNVPFLLFHFFNTHPTLRNVPLDYFWSVFTDVNQPAIIRQSAVMYLTSFTNRAVCVSKADYKRIMLVISAWCHGYIDRNESIKCSHTPFYAASQALFYLFSYRHKDVFSSADWKGFLAQVDLHRIVFCKLNPLRHCNPHILRMFNKLTSMYEIVTCAAVIERNSRLLLPSSSQQHGQGSEDYPFKRSTLRTFSRLIEPFFRDMECSSEFQSEGRKYKVSENFEDWDHALSEAGSVPLSPAFLTMSVDDDH
eukprot:sb/3464766/